MTAFDDLANLPHERIQLSMIVAPRDADGNPTNYYLTDGQLNTERDETPPDVFFHNRLIGGWQLRRQLTQDGQLIGTSAADFGRIAISNAPAPGENAGPFGSWRTLDFNGATATILLGGNRRADGSRWYFSDNLRFDYVIDEAVFIDNDLIELIFRDPTGVLDQLLVLRTYGGWGNAVACQPGRMTAPHESDLTLTKMTMIVVGRPRLPFANANPRLAWKGAPTDAWQILALQATKEIYFGWNGAGHNLQSPFPSAETWDTGIWAIAISINPSGADLYLGEPHDIRLVAQYLSATTLSATTNPLVIGALQTAVGFAQEADFDFFKVAIFNKRLTRSQIAEYAGGPIEDPSGTSNLIRYWMFAENTGTTASSEVGGADLTLEAGAYWTTSRDGDDPRAWPATTRGNHQATGYGRIISGPLSLVDQGRDIYQSTATGYRWLRAHVNGRYLASDWSVVAVGGGDMVATAANKTISFGPSNLLWAYPWVPGQTKPALAGQRLVITNWPDNNGTYTIAAEGIGAGGKTVVVVEALVNSTAPAGAIIETHPDDVQILLDNTAGTIAFVSPLDGTLAADLFALVPGGSTNVAGLAAYVYGAAVDTSLLTWDPQISLIPAGMTRRAALDWITGSALAWWAMGRDGTLRIGSWEPPAGGPVAELVGSEDYESGAPVRCPIARLRRLRVVRPYRTLSCAWGRTWAPQTSGLAGSLPADQRILREQEWRIESTTDPAVVSRYPQAIDREPFATGLVNRGSARTFLARAAAIYQRQIELYEVELATLSLMAIDLRDLVILQWPETTFGLENGVIGWITALSEQLTSAAVTAEVLIIRDP